MYKEARSLYEFNVATLRQYGDRYKVSWMSSQRAAGIAVEKKGKGMANDEKLSCKMRRAKNKIKEYALSNQWEFFCTLTLDKLKQDRYDLSAYIKKLSQMIRDIRKATGANIQYLLVPEQHKDGAWHMHGLLRGLLPGMVRAVPVGKRKRQPYNWIAYSEKFGFSDLERVESSEKVASYITKYVTKEMSSSIKEINAKSYYVSRGLEVSKVIKKGTVSTKYNPSYVKTCNEEALYSEMWLPNNTTLEEALTYLKDTSWTPICQEDGLLVEEGIPLEWI